MEIVPGRFTPEAIAPETAEFNRAVEQALAAAPPITSMELDPLLDDTLFMASRWEAAGGGATLAIEPGAIHGFNGFPTRQAQRANERAYAFITEAIEENR